MQLRHLTRILYVTYRPVPLASDSDGSMALTLLGDTSL